MLNGPIKNGCAAGKVGLVLGCGPGLDLLPNETFRLLRGSGQAFVSVGINRVTASKKLQQNGNYYPDVLLVWDALKKELPKCQDIEKIFAEAVGKSWRVVVANLHGNNYSHDQLLPRNLSCNGGPVMQLHRDGYIQTDGCCLVNSTGDAAINLLWRMGVRKIYIAGIDGYGGYCEWGAFDWQDKPLQSHWTPPEQRKRTLEKWTEIVEGYGDDLELCNINPKAVMVKAGLVSFGIPAWSND